MKKQIRLVIFGSFLLVLSGCAGHATHGGYYGYPPNYYYGYPYYGYPYYGYPRHELGERHEYGEHRSFSDHHGEFEHHGERFEHRGQEFGSRGQGLEHHAGGLSPSESQHHGDDHRVPQG